MVGANDAHSLMKRWLIFRIIVISESLSLTNSATTAYSGFVHVKFGARASADLTFPPSNLTTDLTLAASKNTH